MQENTAPAVNDTEVTDTSTTDSAPVENETVEETVESNENTDDFDQIMQDELNRESDEQVEEDSSESEADEVQEDQTPDEQSAADRRKEQLNQEIRDLVTQRKQAEQEFLEYQQYLQSQQQTNQPNSTEDYLDMVNENTGEYYTSTEAQVELLKQEVNNMRAERQNEQRETEKRYSQSLLDGDAERVLNDYPMFDPQSDQYNKAIADGAKQALKANLIVENGEIVGSRIAPSQLYKAFADAYQSGTASGQVNGQKATTNMLRRVDPGSSSAGAKQETDENKFIKNFFN